MIKKIFGEDFYSIGGALTLPASSVTEYGAVLGVNSTRIHPSGWIITGEVKEDHHVWVSYFEAFHPNYGNVWGDFEDIVYADTEEGFNHFYENHPPDEWDYKDI